MPQLTEAQRKRLSELEEIAKINFLEYCEYSPEDYFRDDTEKDEYIKLKELADQ